MKEMISNLISLIALINREAALAIIAGKHVEISAVMDWRHSLQRWGDNLQLVWNDNRLIYNNLVDKAWSYDERKAKREAARAAAYFLSKEHNLKNLASLRFQIVDGNEVVDI